MFEKVREAGSTFSFITRTDVVIEGDGNNGHRVVFAQNNAQTVGKSKLCDGSWCELESFSHFYLDSSKLLLSVRHPSWE